MTTWLITGCSTGLGRALAQAVLDQGDNLVATARDSGQIEDFQQSHPDSALALALDVTDHARIGHVVAAAEERFGRIDVLINNAGYGYRAAVEEGEDEALETLFATNFFGPVKLIQAVLPDMRSRRSGTIVNISSIGARMSPPGSGFYAATKAALEAMTASLRKEVGPLGITAMIVEPGGFRTDFAGRSLTQSRNPIADYADTAGVRRKEHDTAHGRQPGDPAKAAQALIDVVKGSGAPFMLVLGPDALEGFRGALASLSADLDSFETVSSNTSFS
jgi:NAD(P)-dependent dehydrogenase (short-subunit alcohol dehydrogenase family)